MKNRNFHKNTLKISVKIKNNLKGEYYGWL